MKKTLLSLSAVLAGVAGVSGQVILSDDFSYPNGPLTTGSLGAWVNHSGTAGSFGVTNGAAIIDQGDTAGSREDVNRLFNNGGFNITNDNSSTIYASFTISYSALPVTGDSDGSYFAHFKSSTANEFYARVGANTNGAAPGLFRLAVANESWNVANTVEYGMDLSLNTTYQVVLKFDLATDRATLWIDPTDESSLSVTATDTMTQAGIINAFALRQGTSGTGAPGDLALDNLIVGLNFSDVTTPIPEPATYAFIGLGLAAFWVMSRRKKA